MYGKLEKLENSVSKKVYLPSDSHTKTVISGGPLCLHVKMAEKTVMRSIRKEKRQNFDGFSYHNKKCLVTSGCEISVSRHFISLKLI